MELNLKQLNSCLRKHKSKFEPVWLWNEVLLKSIKEKSKKQIWKEEYSSIDWKDFNENYFQCSRCGTFDNQQCICYAR